MATRKEIADLKRREDIAALERSIKVMERHIPPVGSIPPMQRLEWREAIKKMKQVKQQLEQEGEA